MMSPDPYKAGGKARRFLDASPIQLISPTKHASLQNFNGVPRHPLGFAAALRRLVYQHWLPCTFLDETADGTIIGQYPPRALDCGDTTDGW